MKPRSLMFLWVTAIGVAQGQKGPEPTGTMYSRIPAEVVGFRLTERATVTNTPTDSLFRYRGDSRTTITVIIYEVPADAKVGADSQQWTPRHGERFREVMSVLRERGRVESFTDPVTDTARFAVRNQAILEHGIFIPTRYPNGTVAVEMQFLYLIEGKFLKVRATVPHEEFKESRVGAFARELARRVAGGGPSGNP
jgi:hypothetical protein